MRKDYIAVDAAAGHQGEADFVADHWTKIWRDKDVDGLVGKVPRKEEYRVIRPYLERLPKGSRLLDGGCGLGEWTAYFTRTGLPTLGLDISSETVERLKLFYPGHEFAVGDIRSTGLPAARFDAVFSWGTFEHFENGPDDCIREALRVLKPGGYLFVSTPFDNLRHALAAALERHVGVPPYRESRRFYQWRFTRPELRDALARNGFEVIAVKPIGKRQGMLRTLDRNFGMKWNWRASKLLAAGMAPFIPGGVVAHIILGIARKPL
jgi:SAM-dependent methyltransferase